MQKSVPRSFSTELNLPRSVAVGARHPRKRGSHAGVARCEPSPQTAYRMCRNGAAHPKIYFGILGCSSKQALRADHLQCTCCIQVTKNDRVSNIQHWGAQHARSLRFAWLVAPNPAFVSAFQSIGNQTRTFFKFLQTITICLFCVCTRTAPGPPACCSLPVQPCSPLKSSLIWFSVEKMFSYITKYF